MQKLVKTTEFKSNHHELLHITADSYKSPEDCKDALELSLNNIYDSADSTMEDSEETRNMDQVNDTGRDTNKENGRQGKGCRFPNGQRKIN